MTDENVDGDENAKREANDAHAVACPSFQVREDQLILAQTHPCSCVEALTRADSSDMVVFVDSASVVAVADCNIDCCIRRSAESTVNQLRRYRDPRRVELSSPGTSAHSFLALDIAAVEAA